MGHPGVPPESAAMEVKTNFKSGGRGRPPYTRDSISTFEV